MQEEARDTQFLRSRRMHNTVRSLIGLITGLVGLADMLSAIVPRLDWSILLGAWPIAEYRAKAQIFIVVVGFFLIILSYGLGRGKRHAWFITIILLLLSAVLHIKRSGSVLATVVALLLTLTLYALARFFRARSDPPSAWRGYIALGLGLGVVTFYTIGGFIALWDDFAPLFDRFGVDGVAIKLITFAHIYGLPHNTQAFFFGHALPALCTSAVVYGMYQIFRPVAAVLMPRDDERRRARELVHLYGTNSISYFALGEDKSYFFSRSGKAVISYVPQGSTAVVAGDPIGPQEELSVVIREFVTFCNELDWSIVFWQTRRELVETYRQAGLRLLKIGEDAVVDARNFTLKGGAMANVRSSAKRAEKDGLRVEFYHGRIENQALLEQMAQISRAWLAQKGGAEMGFSMGHFDPWADPALLYMLAVDTQEKVHAFISFVPIYGRRGWSLDLMRRAEQCAPGAMELLLARSIEYIRTKDDAVVSLGVAPLSKVNDENETFLAARLDSLSTRFGNPAKNQSLFNFKKKFQPQWESRYLAYSGTLSLPKIGWAVYHAHQSDASVLGTLRKSLRDLRRNRHNEKTAGALKTARAS